jgi:hypothetical protein
VLTAFPDAYLHKVRELEPSRAGHPGSPSRHMQSFGVYCFCGSFHALSQMSLGVAYRVEPASMVRAIADGGGAAPHSHARVRRSKENQFHTIGRLSHVTKTVKR